MTGRLALSTCHQAWYNILQADLLFKQEEKEKSEATAKTLDLGKNAWNVFIAVYYCVRYNFHEHVCMKEVLLSVYLENAKLQMDLVKVEEVS